MKKVMFSALAVAVLAMTACSTKITTDNGKEIRLRSNISAIESKANPGEALTGITMLRYDAANEAALTYATPTVLSGVGLSGEGAIQFAAPQYYEGSNNAFFIGYYPSPATPSTDNTATFTIDGNTDIMATKVFDAGTRIAPTTGQMDFEHMLAQVDVLIKAETADDIAYFGAIKSIAIADQPTTGTLTCTATPAFVTTAGSGSFSVATAGTLTTAAVSSGMVMIAPQEGTLNGSNKEAVLNLTVETENIPAQTIAVTMKSSTADTYAIPMGKKSTITLTFKRKEISGTGAIAAWGTDGGSGSQEVN